MTTVSTVDAFSNWHEINWAKAHREVRRIQMRIAKAVREGKQRRVNSLQWLLTHSFYGKALAVKRVTENQGQRTPGVDGKTWSTPESKFKAIKELKRKGYKPSLLKRVFIPKANGKERPLGIPTMKDRAMQALHQQALEPISETRADANSYGFRPMRASRDAAEQGFKVLAKRTSAEWILDADISGCFDNISHEWMLKNIPTDREILGKWLKSGFVFGGKKFPTTAGTPQGGIISPTLANMALDGMEQMLKENFGITHYTSGPNRGHVHHNPDKANLVRYADDFVITGASIEVLEKAKTLMTEFLRERGLTLSAGKTHIKHIDQGFDFLGWNIRKYSGKLLIKSAKRNTRNFLKEVRETIKSLPTAKQETLIKTLNRKIKGWANYHQTQVAKKTYVHVDYAIWEMLWKWCARRHPMKGKRWIKDRYFHRAGMRNWVFGAKVRMEDGATKLVRLALASDTPIKRHIKIKGKANPYDPKWELYLEERQYKLIRDQLRGKLKVLWKRQEGKCAYCCQSITEQSGWNTHHRIRKVDGGKESIDNLELLHPNCHRQLHNLENRTAGS